MIMPSYRLEPINCSPLDLVNSSNQLGCHSKASTDQIPLTTATSFHLPSLQLDSEALLSLENFSMITLSAEKANEPLIRSSLEFSEEESFSDESTSQRTSFPASADFFHEHYDQQPLSSSSSSEKSSVLQELDPLSPTPILSRVAAEDSGKKDVQQINPPTKHSFAFLSQPYKAHISKSTSRSTLNQKRSQKFNQASPKNKKTSTQSETHDDHQQEEQERSSKNNSPTKSKLGSQKGDRQSGSNHLEVGPTTSSSYRNSSPPNRPDRSPECQSHTMSSVFEDDSDDETDVHYLKKVLPAWITNSNNNKKSKSSPPPISTSPPATSKLVKQKSRIFKTHRSSLSAPLNSSSVPSPLS
ncbi:hypothetical protein PGT21_034975 [Puccinia graminis f. sp. tritici]|uniref:Uncharacterized protein n=1 Tax=Puccinia graminis f. sp. tritici TaxID=56615 RepID=A0A5B0QCK4_PUCGR|nr:hypothetical protein PGT21_034975 [Puccinia graminis f. sp. tritici]